jgi:hypothetical protein
MQSAGGSVDEVGALVLGITGAAVKAVGAGVLGPSPGACVMMNTGTGVVGAAVLLLAGLGVMMRAGAGVIPGDFVLAAGEAVAHGAIVAEEMLMTLEPPSFVPLLTCLRTEAAEEGNVTPRTTEPDNSSTAIEVISIFVMLAISFATAVTFAAVYSETVPSITT